MTMINKTAMKAMKKKFSPITFLILCAMFVFPNFIRAENETLPEFPELKENDAENETLPEFPELKENDIIHLATDLKISDKELIDIVSASKVIYIGETHDNFSVHQLQLKVIKDLFKKTKGNVAIGMEMFQKRSQEKLDLFINGKISEKEFLQDVWFPDWGFEYEYYRAILEYAKSKKIKIIALNANKATVKMINKKGIDNLSKEERKEIPDIDTTDKYHRNRVKAIFDVHQHSSMGSFENFYRVQCLWDETMAESVAEYLTSKKGKDKHVVVLAGKDHVRYGIGIPKRVFRRVKAQYNIILPIEIRIPDNKAHNIMNVERVDVPLHEADFIWMVNYTDPVINRVKLGVMVLKSERGVIVHIVDEGSSAESIGIKKDDIILEVDGEPVNVPFDLVYEIRNKKPGKNGEIKILRDGKKMTYKIKYRTENALN